MVFLLFYFMNCFDLSLSVTDVSEFWPCQLKVNLVCIFYEFMFYKFYITRTCFIGNAYFDILVGFFRIFTHMSIASDLIQNRIFKVRQSLAGFMLYYHESTVKAL